MTEFILNSIYDTFSISGFTGIVLTTDIALNVFVANA